MQKVWSSRGRVVALAFALAAAPFVGPPAVRAQGAAAAANYVLFESAPVRPLALAPDGQHLYVVNIPDGRLEIFAVGADGLTHLGSVPVGLEPVAVAARSNAEVWVVNHLSDSVSIVDVAAEPPRVVRTLLVGDEPRDIVFAGPDRRRAFITTAHRGQNSPVDPGLDQPGIGRADVWVFDADALGTSLGGDPLTILTLFGDTPGALAASPDGGTVYAAVFKSGNQTTVVSPLAVCDGGETAPPCTIQGKQMPGGLPGPNTNVEGAPQPRTGLIVKYDRGTGQWHDPLGRDWSNAVPITLPDKDVFAIDALATPPVEVNAFSGVGTVIYGMATNPLTGHLYVANTEARNDVRLEPNVRGHIHETQLTVIDGQSVRPRHLNKHIDYGTVPSPDGTRERSLALPAGLAVSADGTRVWIAGFGSSRIGVFDAGRLEDDSFVPAADNLIPVSGGGPAGPVLDAAHQRLYALTRFDNGVTVIDTAARRETAHLLMHTPEPPSVTAGRRFLYDAAYTSSNGEAACASCHVFGDNDALAWDLGVPDQPVLPDPNPRNPLISIDPLLGPFFTDFHPLKGPMTTQTLRGLNGYSPFHWRGDRTGAFAPGGDAHDDLAALRQFNEAFVNLLGRATMLPDEEMDALAAFLLQITPPPNPHRNLDNSLTAAQQSARDEFFRPIQDISCASCHSTDAAAGRFGTDLSSTVNGQSAQLMKVPSLRQTYQKVGMFGLFPQQAGFLPSGTGDQVRGFGFLNDGAAGVFIQRTLDYVMAFETDLAPIVGQQITLGPASSPAVAGRLDLLIARAAAGECDLTVKGVVGNQARGWYRTAGGEFQSDVAADGPVSDETLRTVAGVPGQELTYTCVPPGSGVRLGVDRDGDGFLDGDELAAGSDPDNAASTPLTTPGPTASATPTQPPVPTPTVPACAGDCNGDATVTVDELLRGVNMALGTLPIAECPAFDLNADAQVTVDEILRAVDAALQGCGS